MIAAGPTGFVYRVTTRIPIGTKGTLTKPAAISSRIHVVGGLRHGIQDRERPFLWKDGSITMLPVPAEEGLEADTRGVNAQGWVVGQVASSVTGTFGVLWRDGRMERLDDLAVLPSGYHIRDGLAINDGGAILAVATEAPTERWRLVLLRP